MSTTRSSDLKGENSMPTKQQKPVFGRGAYAGTTSGPMNAAGGYGIWEFSQGAWSLRSAECPTGYTTGEPPAQAGRFDGELIRKYCEPVALDVPVMAMDTD
jgi:hypothetical protein